MKPPSTTSAWPLTNEASSEARNSAAAATSSGCARRARAGGRRRSARARSRSRAGRRRRHRRLDEARADAVHADAAPAVVDREVARQQHHAALRGVVGAAALEALEPFDAREVHDAAAALLEHRAEHVLADEERALQVDVEHALPLFDGERVHRAAARHARGVHEHVDAAVARATCATAAATAPSSRTSATWKLAPGAAFATAAHCAVGRLRESSPATRAPSCAKRSAQAAPIPDAAPGHERGLAGETSHARRGSGPLRADDVVGALLVEFELDQALLAHVFEQVGERGVAVVAPR